MLNNIRLRNNDILEVRLAYIIARQTCINSFHYQCQGLSTGTSQPTDAELLAAFSPIIWNGAFGDGLRNMMSDAVTDVSMTFQTVYPVRSLALVTLPIPTNGAVAGPCNPPTCCISIKRRTILPKQKGRGRVFVGGLPVVWTTDGAVDPANRPDVVTAAGRLDNTVATSFAVGGACNLVPFLFSYENPLNMSTILDCPVDFILRSQRRREVGRGI